MLRVTGRGADGWLASLSYMNDGDLARDNAVIDEAATEAGRDPSEIRRLIHVGGSLRATNAGFVQGPADQWVEELTQLALRDGVGTFVIIGDDPELIQVVGQEIAPAVREAVAAERRSAGRIPAW